MRQIARMEAGAETRQRRPARSAQAQGPASLPHRLLRQKLVLPEGATSPRSTEETAAIRSQANTAKLLVEHPTFMRMRELEVLEKIASAGHLKVVLGGEKGLADRVTNLL